MHHIPPVDTATAEDSDYSTGELVGAVVATFFITILVYTVVLVTVTAVVLRLKRKRYFNLLISMPQKFVPKLIYISMVCFYTEGML